MTEIPGSPVSRHDLDVVREALAIVRTYQPQDQAELEIVLSSRRVKHAPGLRLFGLPVRLSDALDLNEGLLIRAGREPISFDLEEGA